MSAFLVGEDTFTRLYSGFYMHKERLFPIAWRKLTTACAVFAERGDDEETTVLRALYQLNIDAVNQRYDESHSEKMPSAYKSACKLTPHLSLHQFLKSMHCITYQMSEGDVPEHPVFKALADVVNTVQYHLATNNGAYEGAKWG
jgi:hypothetical protein